MDVARLGVFVTREYIYGAWYLCMCCLSAVDVLKGRRRQKRSTMILNFFLTAQYVLFGQSNTEWNQSVHGRQDRRRPPMCLSRRHDSENENELCYGQVTQTKRATDGAATCTTGK